MRKAGSCLPLYGFQIFRRFRPLPNLLTQVEFPAPPINQGSGARGRGSGKKVHTPEPSPLPPTPLLHGIPASSFLPRCPAALATTPDRLILPRWIPRYDTAGIPFFKVAGTLRVPSALTRRACSNPSEANRQQSHTLTWRTACGACLLRMADGTRSVPATHR